MSHITWRLKRTGQKLGQKSEQAQYRTAEFLCASDTKQAFTLTYTKIAKHLSRLERKNLQRADHSSHPRPVQSRLPKAFTFTFPLTTRSLEHHRWLHCSQPVSSIFLSSPQLGFGELQVCPFPHVVFPPLLQSALPSSPFHRALQDGFSQIWWTGDMTIPLQFASLYDGQEVFVWSNCMLDLGTDFFVGNVVFV